MATSVLDKHRDQLEIHETMMGRSRGRLAVALDLLTDALALVGQHGVYCQSTRMPGKPTLDLALVLDVFEHAFMVDHGAGGRDAYIAAFLENVNWEVVEQRHKDSKAGRFTARF